MVIAGIVLAGCGSDKFQGYSDLKGWWVNTNYLHQEYRLSNTQPSVEQIDAYIAKTVDSYMNSGSAKKYPPNDISSYDMASIIAEAADCFGLDRYILTGLIHIESTFQQHAVSSHDAHGLTQFTTIGLKEVHDQLGKRGFSHAPKASIEYFRSKVDYNTGCFASSIGPWTDLWTTYSYFRDQKDYLLTNPKVAVVYGAILLKVLLAVYKKRRPNNSIESLYVEALRSYNGEPNRKEWYYKQVFKFANRLGLADGIGGYTVPTNPIDRTVDTLQADLDDPVFVTASALNIREAPPNIYGVLAPKCGKAAPQGTVFFLKETKDKWAKVYVQPYLITELNIRPECGNHVWVSAKYLAKFNNIDYDDPEDGTDGTNDGTSDTGSTTDDQTDTSTSGNTYTGSSDGNRVLFIGDSHSVQTFGKTLNNLLRQDTSLVIATYAMVSSRPEHWLIGHEWDSPTEGLKINNENYNRYLELMQQYPSNPGIAERVLKFSYTTTPRLDQLLADFRPNRTIIALGTNMLWFAQNNAYDHITEKTGEVIDLINQYQSQCIWVGPPHSRRFDNQDYRTLISTINNVAVQKSCDFIDSYDIVTYPSSGGDGYHYEWNSILKRLAKDWAQGVYNQILSIP